MTLGLVIAVALAAGLGATLLGPRRPWAAGWLGLAGAGTCFLLALALGGGDALRVGAMMLATSSGLRLVTLGWSATSLLLGIVARATGGTGSTTGPSLIAMGASILAMASAEPGAAFGALAAGGVAAVLAPTFAGWLADRDEPPPAGLAARAVGATAGAGLAGVLIAAWGSSPVGPFGGGAVAGVDDPAFRIAVGLALLAMVGTVVVRSGAIPAHLWVARFIGAVSPLAVPASLAWGSAAFTLVALGWSTSTASASGAAMDDAGRILVVLVALASILLGGLAAILHDDLEHVLGYTIIQGAGVALLAFAALGPDATQAARDWLVATAAMTSALAGWIAVSRWAFGAHRVSELHGWARRSPALAAPATIIVVGWVGLPGMAIFDARAALAGGALPGVLGTALALVALSPLVAIGRILVAGIGRPGPEVAATPRDRLGVLVTPSGGWSRGGLSRSGLAWGARTAGVAARANAALIASLATALLAVLGLAFAIVGTGAAG